MAADPTDTQAIVALYDGGDREFMRLIRDAKAPGASRAEEIARFAKCAGYRKIGIAHCVAVTEEAQAFERMLADDFSVTRVDCKVFGIDAGELVEGASGTSCNPAGQAKVLADAGTELNVAMGLCLGHDILFAKHSKAPVTTLVVKDRVHGHNPIAALR
jgi:uncharacterized metal-binding protein